MYLPPFKGFIRVFVLICVGVFILEQVALYGPLGGETSFSFFVRFFGLQPALVFKGMIFQMLTWVFVHGNLGHLLFNMFAFYMFGSMLQETFGNKRFTFFNLYAALFTALIIIGFGLFDPQTYMASTIGASGLVFAVLIGVARLFPDQVILFAFIFPMRMKHFAWLMIAIEFYFLYTSNNKGISNIAHLGGALFGWLYIEWMKRGKGPGLSSNSSWLKDLKEKLSAKKKRKHLRIVYPEDRSKFH